LFFLKWSAEIVLLVLARHQFRTPFFKKAAVSVLFPLYQLYILLLPVVAAVKKGHWKGRSFRLKPTMDL
jgi:hypothetical protein